MAATLPFLIKSTPYFSGGYEFSLHVLIKGDIGEKVGQTIDLIYENEQELELEGFILTLERSTGEQFDIGSTSESLPIELLEQMRSEQGLELHETNEKGVTQAIYILRL